MSAAPALDISEDALLGVHPAIVELRRQITCAAVMRTPVLVEGPTGVGKELVVQRLYRESGLSGKLVPMNAAAVPESLAEAELFGAVRGAYTGLAQTRSGHVHDARGGMLFLDEAGDLPLTLQAKLLRVLESGEVGRLGSLSTERVDFRLVVSVQESPGRLVQAGRWRADFRYRVCGIRLRVPPLQARMSDVPLLAAHFAAAANLQFLHEASLAPLQDFTWPGNVRQLRQVIERAGFLAAPGPITSRAIAASLASEADSEAEERLPDRGRPAAQELRELLGEHQERVSRVADHLRVCRGTVYRWMREYGLRPRRAGA